jgi:heptosyltransferase-1
MQMTRLGNFNLAEGRNSSMIRKILVVKTSSFGDVVHNFPAISDIRKNHPEASIDWVVEEAYVPLVGMHPGVRKAIPVAQRRWRRQLLRVTTWNEINALRKWFKNEPYDAVIDTQGLLKSALLADVANGTRHGFDSRSARERIATFFYDKKHRVACDKHAVARNRELASLALGYQTTSDVDYGLIGSRNDRCNEGEIVLLHSTSRSDKYWPEENWVALGRQIESSGGRMVLPWGNASERSRSQRIAKSLDRAEVPEAMSIDALAGLLGRCAGVVGLDTGLTHLAAALGTPLVAIYVATDPALTGVFGAIRATNLGGLNQVPTALQAFQALIANGAM